MAATSERDTASDTASDNELVINRTFNAPRALVWKAWTEKMDQWSAPRGFSMPVSEGELRPGGAWRACMRTPEGKDLWLGGVYREIVEPDRLVFTHSWDNESGQPGPETVVTVTLTENGGKTDMHFRQTGFSSADSRDGHNGGWTQSFEKLEEMLAA